MAKKKLEASEQLKQFYNRQPEESNKASAEHDAAIMAQAQPHINALQKYINKPDDIAAYLMLNKDEEGLSTAVYEVFWKECDKSYFEAYNDEQLRDDKNFLDALETISNTEPPQRPPNIKLFETTTCPRLLLSLFFLCNYLRRQNQIIEDISGDLSGLFLQMILKHSKPGLKAVRFIEIR